MSYSGVDVKEQLYWDFVEVDKYSYPILYNAIYLRNNTFHNLLDYGNEYIEKLLIIEYRSRKF